MINNLLVRLNHDLSVASFNNLVFSDNIIKIKYDKEKHLINKITIDYFDINLIPHISYRINYIFDLKKNVTYTYEKTSKTEILFFKNIEIHWRNKIFNSWYEFLSYKNSLSENFNIEL